MSRWREAPPRPRPTARSAHKLTFLPFFVTLSRNATILSIWVPAMSIFYIHKMRTNLPAAAFQSEHPVPEYIYARDHHCRCSLQTTTLLPSFSEVEVSNCLHLLIACPGRLQALHELIGLMLWPASQKPMKLKLIKALEAFHCTIW